MATQIRFDDVIQDQSKKYAISNFLNQVYQGYTLGTMISNESYREVSETARRVLSNEKTTLTEFDPTLKDIKSLNDKVVVSVNMIKAIESLALAVIGTLWFSVIPFIESIGRVEDRLCFPAGISSKSLKILSYFFSAVTIYACARGFVLYNRVCQIQEDCKRDIKKLDGIRLQLNQAVWF